MLHRWLNEVRKGRLLRRGWPNRPRRTGQILAVEALEERSLLSTVTWINPGGGDWSAGSNWSSGSTPGAGDDVVIDQPGNIVVTHSQNVTDTVHSLTTSDTLQVLAGIVKADTAQNSGTVTIAAGSILAANSYTQLGGTTQVQGGTLGALLPPETTASSFSGAGQVQAASSASLNPVSQLTVEAWINPSSPTSPQEGIVGKWDDLTGNNRSYLLWIQDGHLAAYISHQGTDFTGVVSPTTLPTNQWSHVAVTFDGNALQLYVNGTLEAITFAPGPIFAGNQPLLVGRVDGGGGLPKFFTGQIADVRVWNVAQPQSAIQANMNQELTGSEPGLVSSWRLNEASGGTVLDQTNQNNGTLGGTVPPVFTSVLGGNVNSQGSTLTGSGTINGNLFNAGEVALSGALTVRGNYTQTATGALDLGVGGTSPGSQFGQLEVASNVALDGTLNVTLLNGFSPLAGQTFAVLDANSVSGNFATITLPAADGVTAFQVSANANSVVLVGATVPPTSAVSALPAFSSPSFTVSWAGQDNPGGSGVASFDIYVSDNGGAFVPFLTNTSTLSATFLGQRGHAYAFYSVATDGVGNREAAPATADATTAVPTQVSTTTTLVTSAPAGSTYGLNVTLTASVSASLPVFGAPTGSVQFLVDGTNFGAAVALTGSSASLTTSALTAGAHVITAAYLSDTSDFAASPGGPLSQSIAQAALLVTVDNKTKVYGAALPALTGTITGLKNGDNISATYRSQATAASGVGSYSITATLADPNGRLGNYTVTVSPGTLTVTPATLTVTADNKTKALGSPVPTLTASYTGLVNGDTVAVLSGAPSLSTTANASSPAGTYSITAGPGTLSAANYVFTFVNGTLTVTAATTVSTTTSVVSSVSPSVFAQPITFTATVAPSASGAGTPAGNVTFFDGTTALATVALTGGTASFTTDALARGNHVITAMYAGSGAFLASTSAPLTQTVQIVALESDPLDPTKNDLAVGGTAGNDVITIESAEHGTKIKVSIYQANGSFRFENFYPTAGLARLLVYGGPGDDYIRVDDSVTLPALLFGGGGNDTLIGGSAFSALIGGTGNDALFAGRGRNILIGGGGHDALHGRAGDNILIGGMSADDTNVAALCALMAEWSRTDEDYFTRISHLLGPEAGGFAGGRNGRYHLNASTVHADSGSALFGGDGKDWFFVGLGSSTPGKRPGEVVTTIH